MPLLLDAPLDSQPQEAVEADWGNPLTIGIVAAGTYGADGVVAAPLTPNAEAATIRIPGGVAMGSTTSDGVWTLANRFVIPASSEITVFALALSTVSNATRKRVMRVYNATNGSLMGIDFANGSSNEIEGFGQLAGGTFNDVKAGFANTANVQHAVAFRRAGTAATLFVDGVQRGAGTFASGSLNGAPTSVSVANSGSTFQIQGGVLCYAVWARALSNDEIRSVSANPWQLFRAPVDAWVPSVTPTVLTPIATLDNTLWTASSGTVHGALAAVGGPRITSATSGASTHVRLG